MEGNMTNKATIQSPIQGEIHINNIQGNYYEMPLVLTDGDDLPIDLSNVEIVMEIKELPNVNQKPFIKWTKGNGLSVFGADNNGILFVLDAKFWESQVSKYVYDIAFTFPSGQSYTWIKGTITNVNTVSKP
jgi:hypothetical protein